MGMARGPSAFCACLGLEQTSHVSASLGFPMQAEPFITYLELLHCLGSFGLGDVFPCGKQAGSRVCHKFLQPPGIPSLTAGLLPCCCHAVGSLGAQTKSLSSWHGAWKWVGKCFLDGLSEI